MNNLNEVPSVKIGTILGYECYVPKSYYFPISFLNKGCPVWIKTGEDGNCNVMTIGNGNAYEEIGDYIKTTLDKRSGYRYKRVLKNGELPISCQILDENGTVCAEIIVNSELFVQSIKLGNSAANDYLSDYFLSDYNIRGYESKILRINRAIISEASILFNLLSDENGKYIQLG